MTYPIQRKALILLAGTALTLCALPAAAQSPQAEAPKVLDLPPVGPARAAAVTATEQEPTVAVAAPGVDTAAHARSRHHRRHAAASAPVEDAQPATYKVRRGDTVEKVASKLGTDTETLIRLNGLKKPYRLRPGQVLKGPEPEALPPLAWA